MRVLITIILACMIAAACQTAVPDSAEVYVIISGFKSDLGYCRLLFYKSSKGFPEDPDNAFIIKSGKIVDKKAGFTFKAGLGTYAISILHDENSNEKLDKTWYGKPKEGFGISNNPKVRFGPPSFDESALLLEKGKNSITIRMIYL
ncbi:MAG TPA: DUF2141 domain-containing protein [Clostridiales bacterium]|jgi:uncharacterized protein (DUF2141 family)|nr:DUF2141 domain-containing protein [Clostridiales bacterium]HQP70488.1 DUF2141 domain-containing protein [Clostridiales bacterium]